MQIVLKGVHSPDVDLADVTTLSESQVLVELEIGPSDKEGGDIFYLTVCDAAALEAMASKSEGVVLRGFLLSDKCSGGMISRVVNNIIRNINVDNWDSAALILSGIFIWEYENYRNNL